MDLKELVHAVAVRSGLAREESADITRAVVEMLAEQLSESEARRLAIDLPDQLAGQMQAPRRRKQGAHPVAVEELIRQLSERTGLKEEEARAGTAAVLASLRDALSEENYRHLFAQLPAGYAALAGPAS